MTDEKKEKVIPQCIICGSTNTEELGRREDSYGEFVLAFRCKDCGVEFDTKG